MVFRRIVTKKGVNKTFCAKREKKKEKEKKTKGTSHVWPGTEDGVDEVAKKQYAPEKILIRGGEKDERRLFVREQRKRAGRFGMWLQRKRTNEKF